MMMIGSVTTDALHSALTGLSQRSRVTADNIANIQTPGFLAGRVEFESALREAITTGAPAGSTTASVSRSLEPTVENGNNVNLDTETVIATETGLRYQLALRAMGNEFDVMRSAMRTS